jgi:hypothetical protein
MTGVMRRLNAFATGFTVVFSGIATAFLSMSSAADCCFPAPSKPQTRADILEGFRKDREALAPDWRKVGSDIRNAMNSYVETH